MEISRFDLLLVLGMGAVALLPILRVVVRKCRSKDCGVVWEGDGEA